MGVLGPCSAGDEFGGSHVGVDFDVGEFLEGPGAAAVGSWEVVDTLGMEGGFGDDHDVAGLGVDEEGFGVMRAVGVAEGVGLVRSHIGSMSWLWHPVDRDRWAAACVVSNVSEEQVRLAVELGGGHVFP